MRFFYHFPINQFLGAEEISHAWFWAEMDRQSRDICGDSCCAYVESIDAVLAAHFDPLECVHFLDRRVVTEETYHPILAWQGFYASQTWASSVFSFWRRIASAATDLPFYRSFRSRTDADNCWAVAESIDIVLDLFLRQGGNVHVPCKRPVIGESYRPILSFCGLQTIRSLLLHPSSQTPVPVTTEA